MGKVMTVSSRLTALAGALLFFGSAAMAVPVDSSFTYQGKLTDTGQPVDGVTCDFRFGLWDAETGGAQVGSSPITRSAALSSSLFKVDLDFGAVFDTGQKRWLEIEVQCPDDVSFTTLSPRTEVKGAPQAQYALTAGQANAVSWPDVQNIPADIADGDDIGSQIVGGGSAFNVGGTGDSYLPLAASSSTNDFSGAANLIPLAGTITDFQGHLSAATSSGSYTFTLMKNAGDTVVTCTASSPSDLSCSDFSNCVSYSGGDFIAVRATGTNADNRQVRWSAVFTPGGSCL